jgi:hypothetical protein
MISWYSSWSSSSHDIVSKINPFLPIHFSHERWACCISISLWPVGGLCVPGASPLLQRLSCLSGPGTPCHPILCLRLIASYAYGWNLIGVNKTYTAWSVVLAYCYAAEICLNGPEVDGKGLPYVRARLTVTLANTSATFLCEVFHSLQ